MENQTYRANDDGEPNHSAGDPILGQIRSFDLTNVFVIVVRYFGGTKLGVGGLINAYKLATESALTNASKKCIFETINLELRFPYDILSNVERLIQEFEIEVIERDFQLSCKVDAIIKKNLKDDFLASTTDLYTLEIETLE